MSIDFEEKIKKIKLVITDVDGVLTDGGMYYNDKGECMKKFNTKDSMGMELLLENGIKTIFMTREKSKIVEERVKKIKIVKLYSDILKKEKMIPEILEKYNVIPDQIAYIGDDLNDLQIINAVGFSATPSDGNYIIKKNVDYTCEVAGGMGAFREFADLINKKKTD